MTRQHRPDAGGGREPRRSGRRTGESGTREAILAAARAQFAGRGYDGATIRAIAAAAEVDPALVHHFYGSKEQLFAAAMRLPLVPSEVLTAALAASSRDPQVSLGMHLARTVLGVWEREDVRGPFLGLLRSAVTSEQAAGMLREFVTEAILRPVAAAAAAGPGGAGSNRDLAGRPGRAGLPGRAGGSGEAGSSGEAGLPGGAGGSGEPGGSGKPGGSGEAGSSGEAGLPGEAGDFREAGRPGRAESSGRTGGLGGPVISGRRTGNSGRPAAAGAGETPPEFRAALAASQMVGLALTRYVLGLGPIAAASAEDLAAAIGPTLERYLTGDVVPPAGSPPAGDGDQPPDAASPG